MVPARTPGSSRSIAPEVYDRAYLLSNNLEGYRDYLDGSLSPVKRRQLDMLDLQPSHSLLEIGMGRGEFLRECAGRVAQVTGIDYSRDAFDISRETLRGIPDADLRVADSRQLPFASDSFDRVFSGDVIEHMSFDDGVRMLREAFRVLKPGGQLLIHTAPNTLFTHWVYPAAKPLLSLIDRASIEALDQHMAVGRNVHVHEYNWFLLRRVARDAGLHAAQVWIDSEVLRGGQGHARALSGNLLVRLAGWLGKLGPVRLFLGNDLYLRCRKPARSA
jgi:ubiquinone/menaquinone biosynthesis C-methylase UbiE